MRPRLTRRAALALVSVSFTLLVWGCDAPRLDAGDIGLQQAPSDQRCNTMLCDCRDQACAAGLVCDTRATWQCRAPLTCASLACYAQGRTCAENGVDEDATCAAACDGDRGFVADGQGGCAVAQASCDPCDAAHRACSEIEGERICAGCLAGFREVLGACVPMDQCDALDCATLNRACLDELEGQPVQAVCQRCLPSFVEVGDEACGCPPGTFDAGPRCEPLPANAEGGACAGEPCDSGCCARLGLACDAQVGCLAECVAPEHYYDGAADACVPAPHEGCAVDQVFNGLECVPMPDCGEDEDGDPVQPLGTELGWFICPTEQGSFWSPAGAVGPQPCDADGDGWVRASARYALESPDAVVQANARCTLTTLRKVKLRSETCAGNEEADDCKTAEYAVTPPLPRYESVRNDDDQQLQAAWARAELDGARLDNAGLSAGDLNPLTKYCDQALADYNDNGLPDATEVYNPTDPAQAGAPTAAFSEFAYFVALHTAEYADGTLTLTERPRADLPFVAALQAGEAVDDPGHWTRCPRGTDPSATRTRLGNDFAQKLSGGAPFMLHHTQFKCVTTQTYDAQRHEPQTCHYQDQDHTCEAAAGVEDAGWAVVRYQAHRTEAEYPGGCMNLCAAAQAGLVTGCTNGDLCAPEESARTLACKACGEGGEAPQDDAGQPIGCVVDGALGECAKGTMACVDNAARCEGPGPVNETCDGLDNDCDGRADQGLQDARGGIPDVQSDVVYAPDGRPVDRERLLTERGVCGGPYLWACVDGQETYTLSQPFELRETLCDGLDNDCNGAVDDTWGPVPGGLPSDVFGGRCNTGELGPCAEGRWQCGDPDPVCVSLFREAGLATPAEQVFALCDGLDNDCSGVPDDGSTCERRPDRDQMDQFPYRIYLVPVATTEDHIIINQNSVKVTFEVSLAATQAGTLNVEAFVHVDEDAVDPDYDTEGQAHKSVEVPLVDDPIQLLGEANFRVVYEERSGDGGRWGVDIPPGPVSGNCREGVGAYYATGPRLQGLVADERLLVGSTLSDSVANVYCNNLYAYCDANNNNRRDGQLSPLQVDGQYLDGHAYCVVEIDPYFRMSPTCQADGLEICDGADNDCDGHVDNLPWIGEPCGTDVGRCQVGQRLCADGVEICQQAVEPKAEVCNGLDDDCDGEVDEDRIPCGTPCGPGTRSCRDHPNACFVTCPDDVLGEARYRVCDPETRVFGHCTALSCDGVDDDDDGQVDEGTQACETGCIGDDGPIDGVRHCADPVQSCFQPQEDGGLAACVAEPNEAPEWSPDEPTCDGAHGDEQIRCYTPCGVGSSSCAPACGPDDRDCQARDVCSVGVGLVCLPNEDGEWGRYDCDDGHVHNQQEQPVDNAPCAGTAGGYRFEGVLRCVERAGQAVPICDHDVPGSRLEVCDGQDNDGDGLVDEQRQPCVCGSEVGTRACNDPEGSCFRACALENGEASFRQCDGDAWGACGAESCDGRDNNNNGRVDEGPIRIPTECGLGYSFCGARAAPLVACLGAVGFSRCIDGALSGCADDARATEICDGLDNDGDGDVDERDGLPWQAGSRITCAVPNQQAPCLRGQVWCVNGAIECLNWQADCQ